MTSIHRAIESGANMIAEGFLFTVAAGLIIGETWRSSRNTTKRRDAVDDQLDDLKESVESLNKRIDTLARHYEERMAEESMRYVLDLSYVVRVLLRVHMLIKCSLEGTMSFSEYCNEWWKLG